MSENSKETVTESFWGDRTKSQRIAVAGFGIGLTVLVFHYIYPIIAGLVPLLTTSTRNQFAATSIFASTLLTFALIVVYYDIAETQAIQAKTLQNQEALLEIERRPYIEIVDYQFNRDQAIRDVVYVSNHGQGVALSLSFVAKVEFTTTNGLEPSVCIKPISRFDTHANRNRRDRSIPARTNDAGFEAKACIGLIEDGVSNGYPIPHAFREAQVAEIEQIQFQFYVRYFNILGEINLAKVTFPRSINIGALEKGRIISCLSDMIEYSEPIQVLGEDVEFEELEPDDIIDASSEASVAPDII